ncbi:ATP-dependent DNA ligase [Rhizosphaericola mali]|uniref:DNA ligase (ATP) n=1 Tax=Rhizosphaericola mali TaxID=2545455 RepID=A0A5P2FYW1_9BACT|nr:ATP-dependent DNA ligase [Rhizosphaericola mali]QES88117.1 ATP-dependent DNA ligase [Rhizosphaericola mali]
MKTFATLIKTLDSTNKTNAKIDAIISFLEEASNADKLWFLALFTGKRPKRMVNSALMKQWAMQEANIPEWLFVESYLSVGDLGETIALILPSAKDFWEFSLSEWMDKITQLKDGTEERKKEFVIHTWHHLDLTERFIFNKLIGGSFRIGVSAKTLINAIAKHFQLEPSAVAHSIMGDWDIKDVDFDSLVLGKYSNTNLSKPYPFCLAYPLEKDLAELGNIDQWQIEYKWDGIRGQFIKRKEENFIWSRGEELVNAQFPELLEDLQKWQGDFVLDGEILACNDGKVLDFSELQKRLNRKTISKKMQEEIPIVVFAYDLLELNGMDLRAFPLSKRRAKLEQLFQQNKSEKFSLSPIISIQTWDKLPDIRANAREINSEGVMLKNVDSPYHVGRKKGDWWKWKIEPMTIDAVLIYAQNGSGRRSSYYTDYTFAVKKEDQLVTIAKAYSGLTDKEIQEVSRFVNKNALEKFGPVRTVKPELVFEIAFEGIGFSNRHKSGVALRFPRILRWRKDKRVNDIDDIETIKEMIH